MRNFFKRFGIIALAALIAFVLAGCEMPIDEAGNPDGDGTGGTGDPKDNAKTVTVGYSSSHTIASSGEHWFKFTGTGDPIIFETSGAAVDTYMRVEEDNNIWAVDTDDNSGEGNNALCAFGTTSGTVYFIQITARSSTSGTYSFLVKSPTSNLRANPISVSVGNASSHTIYSSGTHWFRFTGDGDRVFFETGGNVVSSNIQIYTGDNTSYTYSGTNGANFITVAGQVYYINITGNSGTYTFNVQHGTGDGSSRYEAIEVSSGYSGSHTITSSGTHWFIYQGTGNPVTFYTTGAVVDTYIRVDDNIFLGFVDTDDNSGEGGNNALCAFTATSGTNYYISITARSSTSGSYTFIVE